MLVKIPTSTSPRVIRFRKLDRQLEDLYSRRLAIEELIHSLEDYERFRAKRVEVKDQKTA